MKKLFPIILLFSSFIFCQSLTSNIDLYKSNIIIIPKDNQLEVKTYVEIFNRNLQFVKFQDGFKSSYELKIAIIDES